MPIVTANAVVSDIFSHIDELECYGERPSSWDIDKTHSFMCTDILDLYVTDMSLDTVRSAPKRYRNILLVLLKQYHSRTIEKEKFIESMRDMAEKLGRWAKRQLIRKNS